MKVTVVLPVLAALAFCLMAFSCEKGSSVNSDPVAYCKTHYTTKDTCEADTRCKWGAERNVCKDISK